MALPRRDVLIGGIAAGAGWKCLGSSSLLSIDAFVDARLREARIPGAAVGFAKDGRVRFARGYGYANVAARRRVVPSTLFHIASVTKPVTATAVMKLVEDGRMALDAPINDYLDFQVNSPAHPHVPIRIRHLLTHTSGIAEDVYQSIDFRVHGRDTNLPLRDFLTGLLVPGGRYYSATGCFSNAVPGTTWNYVNTGFALLGYLAGRVAGCDLRRYIDQRVFGPLGIRHFAWKLSDVPAASAAVPYDDVTGRIAPVAPMALPDWPAGMLRASVAGLTRFVAMAANQGHTGSARILSESTMEQMLAMQSYPGLPTWLTGQGLAWAESPLAGVRRPNHWGGDPGVFTVAYLDPSTRSGAVVLTNATATPARKDAVQAIAAKLFAEGA